MFAEQRRAHHDLGSGPDQARCVVGVGPADDDRYFLPDLVVVIEQDVNEVRQRGRRLARRDQGGTERIAAIAQALAFAADGREFGRDPFEDRGLPCRVEFLGGNRAAAARDIPVDQAAIAPGHRLGEQILAVPGQFRMCREIGHELRVVALGGATERLQSVERRRGDAAAFHHVNLPP